MSGNYEGLTESPYDDEPSSHPWVKGLAVAIVLILVVLGAFWLLNSGDDPSVEGDDLPAETVGDTTTLATATTTSMVEQELGLGPEPEFDPTVSGYGYEDALESADEDASYSALQAWKLGGRNDDTVFVVGYSPLLAKAVVRSDSNSRDGGDFGAGSSSNAATRCIGFTDTGGASSDCWSVDETSVGRSVMEGQELWLNILAWVDLPETASVGVLNVNSEAVAWQRPRYGFVAFSYLADVGDVLELVVLDASGETLAVIDRTDPSASKTVLDPITGYGDFSDTLFEDIDSHDVQERIVQCLSDQGIEATIVQGMLFSVTMDRCRAGLRLQAPAALDSPEVYHWYEEIYACFADLGYDTGPVPVFDEWFNQPSGTRWDPTVVLYRKYEAASYDDSADSPTNTCVIPPE